MKTVKLSDSVWHRLQRHAIPLEDSLDDVINRLLDRFERADTQEALTNEQASSATAVTEPPAIPAQSKHLPAIGPHPVTRPRRFARSRSVTTDQVLRTRGRIGPGTRIGVIADKLPNGTDPGDRRFLARFGPNAKDVIWEFDGKTYSISELSRLLAQYGVRANPDSENGYRVFGLLSDRSESLEALRKRLESRSDAR